MALCLLTLTPPPCQVLLHPPLPGVSNCFRTFKNFESFKNNFLVFICLYVSLFVFYMSLLVFNLSLFIFICLYLSLFVSNLSLFVLSILSSMPCGSKPCGSGWVQTVNDVTRNRGRD